ncbi:50S ribosomal protein L25 [Clostridium sp.]|uniref:50S ribosomal protein L25 n=1 Tax=Clostridium sp. TaxID=1506 RepID=UPI0026DA7FFC|nr:50S ribosomal protein L25 [Clostridium sp.]MDO5039039.1 50S ribosomal protein L25 [Clostridium sp.]
MAELNITERKRVTHSGRKTRNKGLVPGVVYGKEMKNFMFEVSSLELCREVANVGEHGVLSLNINGNKRDALIKEVQREPVNHEIIHLDLELISSNQNIETEVPIQYLGEKYLNNKGAVLQKEKDSIKVSCDLNSIPKSIKFDVSKGMNGDVFRVCDLEIAEELNILDDLNSVMASISNERKLTSDLMDEEQKANNSEKNK